MAGNSTAQSDALIRANVWSNELKDVLQDELMAHGIVKWLDNFPDGTQLNIPSVGTLEARNLAEDQEVTYEPLDTGTFSFTITEYVQSGTYITNKAKQELFYASELISQFVPKQARALAERLEADIMKQGQPGVTGGQTVAATNQINGVDHRWVGADTLNSKKVLGITDFAKALYSLKKANVPQNNLMAIVDPSTEFYLNTLTNLVNFSNNPKWEGIVESGLAQDMRFVKNIFGFDIYTSNRLALCGSGQTGTAESIHSVSSGTNAVCNLFFSANSEILPFVGAWRQMPKVDGEYNKDFQREEYVTTARYGLKLYRPENFITILSDPSAVV